MFIAAASEAQANSEAPSSGSRGKSRHRRSSLHEENVVVASRTNGARPLLQRSNSAPTLLVNLSLSSPEMDKKKAVPITSGESVAMPASSEMVSTAQDIFEKVDSGDSPPQPPLETRVMAPRLDRLSSLDCHGIAAADEDDSADESEYYTNRSSMFWTLPPRLLDLAMQHLVVPLTGSFAVTRDWWAATSSTEYLADSNGRRRSWQCTLPLLILASGTLTHYGVGQCSYQNKAMPESLAFVTLLVMATVVTLFLPRRNLCPDFLLELSLVISCFMPCLLSSGEHIFLNSECELFVLPPIFLAPLFCCAGLHALIVIIGCLALVISHMVVILPDAKPYSIIAAVTWVCSFGAAFILMEHYAAKVFFLEAANNRLVAACGDGVMRISVQSGVVLETCHSTSHHFGQLEGRLFTQLLPRWHDQTSFQEFLVAASKGDFRSIVVTCRGIDSDDQAMIWPYCNQEFEVKLVPFMCLRNGVRACLQIQSRGDFVDRDCSASEQSSLPSEAAHFNVGGEDTTARRLQRRHTFHIDSAQAGTFAKNLTAARTSVAWSDAKSASRRSSEAWSVSELSISEEASTHSVSCLSNLFLKPASCRSSVSAHCGLTSSRRSSASGDVLMKSLSFRSSRSAGCSQLLSSPCPSDAGGNRLPPLGSNTLLPGTLHQVVGKKGQQFLCASKNTPKKEASIFRFPFRSATSHLRKDTVEESSTSSASSLSFSESEGTKSQVSSSPRHLAGKLSLLLPTSSSTCPNLPVSQFAHESDKRLKQPIQSESFLSTSSPSTQSSDSHGSPKQTSASAPPVMPRIHVTTELAVPRTIENAVQTEAFLCPQCVQSARPPLPPVSTSSPPVANLPQVIQGFTGRRSSGGKGKPQRSAARRYRSQSWTSTGSVLQIPVFAATPNKSKLFSLELVLSCWNVPCNSSSCCSWHAAIESLRGATEELEKQCRKQWLPFRGAQCHDCQCLLEEDEPCCLVCSASQGSSPDVSSRHSSILSGKESHSRRSSLLSFQSPASSEHAANTLQVPKFPSQFCRPPISTSSSTVSSTSDQATNVPRHTNYPHEETDASAIFFLPPGDAGPDS